MPGAWRWRRELSCRASTSDASLLPVRPPLTSEAADAREGDLRAQLAAAKRESQDVVKASRAAEASSSALDTRLARATEEAERARAQLQAERADAAEREKDLRSKCEALGVQLKRAERQRSELLVAFKKQLRLIDVLKRQRIHVRVGPTPRGRLLHTRTLLPTDGGRPITFVHGRRIHARTFDCGGGSTERRSFVVLCLMCAGGLKTCNPRGNRRLGP